MKTLKYILLVVGLLIVVSPITQAQVSPVSEKISTLAGSDKFSSKAYSITSVAGATETVAIDVTDKDWVTIMIYTGSTVSGNIDGVTKTGFVLKGSPMNPAASSASTYTEYAPISVIPISSATDITAVTTSMNVYGSFRTQITGMGKIKISWAAPDAGTTTKLVITTK